MTNAVADEMSRAREALDTWRATRPRGARIPEELWARAVQLAERYGFATTSYRLRWNPEQFRRRLDGTKPTDAASRKKPIHQTSFVEVPSADLVSASLSRPQVRTDAPRSAEVISARIERADGARLSLDLPVDDAHLGSLLAAFLRA